MSRKRGFLHTKPPAHSREISLRQLPLIMRHSMVLVGAVLVILGVIAALVVPRLTGTQQQAYRQAAEVAIKDLQAKIERYAIQHDGTYPQSLEDLLKPVDKNGKPMAPYIEELPKDPWGQVFNYQVETDSTTGQVIVKIWSNGPNRQNENGAGDDVTSWNKEQ